MNRELIVTLLQKDIQELEMITRGFMEMSEYPAAIIELATRKSEDIQGYIRQLSEVRADVSDKESKAGFKITKEAMPENISEILPEPEVESETENENNEHEATFNPEDKQELEDVEVDVAEVIEPEPSALHEDAPEIEVVVPAEDVLSVVRHPETRDEMQKTTTSDQASTFVTTRNEALSKEDNSIVSALGNRKIADIREALNIGDRFRFQRELFRSNGEDMNKTLNYINQLATFTEVQSFLQSKYGWDEENPAAKDFYQLVRRRFL